MEGILDIIVGLGMISYLVFLMNQFRILRKVHIYGLHLIGSLALILVGLLLQWINNGNMTLAVFSTAFPASFLINFQLIRYVFYKFQDRELIVYLRGVTLKEDEEKLELVFDGAFSIILLLMTFVTPLLIFEFIVK